MLGLISRVCAMLITPNHSVPGISAVPHEDNLRYFDVSIHGPTQSPYEGQDTHRATWETLESDMFPQVASSSLSSSSQMTTQ
jgi:hypothetical protein